jgi:hypothetical protein
MNQHCLSDMESFEDVITAAEVTWDNRQNMCVLSGEISKYHYPNRMEC